MATLVASVGHPHTSIYGDGRPDAFYFLPLQLFWFKDGLFVTGAAQAYHSLLAGKLSRIGGMCSDRRLRVAGPIHGS